MLNWLCDNQEQLPVADFVIFILLMVVSFRCMLWNTFRIGFGFGLG